MSIYFQTRGWEEGGEYQGWTGHSYRIIPLAPRTKYRSIDCSPLVWSPFFMSIALQCNWKSPRHTWYLRCSISDSPSWSDHIVTTFHVPLDLSTVTVDSRLLAVVNRQQRRWRVFAPRIVEAFQLLQRGFVEMRLSWTSHWSVQSKLGCGWCCWWLEQRPFIPPLICWSLWSLGLLQWKLLYRSYIMLSVSKSMVVTGNRLAISIRWFTLEYIYVT